MLNAKSTKNLVSYDINIKNWSILGSGEGHIVLQNNQQKDKLFDKVLIICIHQRKPVPEEIMNLYFDILSKMDGIKSHLLQMEKVDLDAETKQSIIELISYRIKQPEQILQKFVVFIAQNLARSKQKWTHYLEFKPKSPLPDQYSKILLERCAKQSSISVQQLKQYISNRPFQERTRWFKKNSLKKQKKNENPLQIFQIFTQSLPRLFQNAHQFPQYRDIFQLTQHEKGQINKNILEQIKKLGILDTILRLQLLYIKPNPDESQQFHSIWQKIEDKQQFVIQTNRQLISKVNSCDQPLTIVKQLYKMSILNEIKQQVCFKRVEELLIDELCFLMSWSWRDVSLFIRLRLHPLSHNIQNMQVKIIDYELKDTLKISSTIHKDRKYLSNYIEFLRNIYENDK